MRRGARGHYAYPVAETDLPLVRIGQDALPTGCADCGSTMLSRHLPDGADRYGLMTCLMCGRAVCRVTPEPRGFRWPQPAPQAAPAPDGPLDEPLPGCTAICSGDIHDPQSHEDYGRQSLLEDIVTRPWAYGMPLVWRVAVASPVGSLVVDLACAAASLDGRVLDLAPTEWRILACLARRQGRVVEQLDLIESVWGTTTRRLDAAAQPAARPAHKLRITVARLRTKLGAAGALVTTTPGIGYMLVGEHGGRDV